MGKETRDASFKAAKRFAFAKKSQHLGPDQKTQKVLSKFESFGNANDKKTIDFVI